MKHSYAKFNEGKVEYYGANKIKTLPLFQTEEFLNSDIDNYMLECFSGKAMTVNDILEGLIDTTEYLDTDIIKSIKRLKETKKILYTPIPAKTPTGRIKKKIDNTDIVKFP